MQPEPWSPAHPFEACERRVARAAEHMARLQNEFQQHADEHKDVFEPFYDPKFDIVRIFQRREGEPFPPICSILIGETVYNLRAALDYMVFVLASTEARKRVEDTQFPMDDDAYRFEGRKSGVYRDKDGKRAKCKAFLACVPDEFVDEIRKLQPCHNCDWTTLLRDISNPDKHQELVGLLPRLEPEHESERKGDTINLKLATSVEAFFPEGDQPVFESLELLHTQVGQTIRFFKGALERRINRTQVP